MDVHMSDVCCSSSICPVRGSLELSLFGGGSSRSCSPVQPATPPRSPQRAYTELSAPICFIPANSNFRHMYHSPDFDLIFPASYNLLHPVERESSLGWGADTHSTRLLRVPG